MANINKVSQAVSAQTPDFIGSDYPLFNRFIEYYYKSQEKTGLGQNVINNFLQYLDIDKLDIGILDGATKVVEEIDNQQDTIVVESVDEFLTENGSVLIGDEVIYYEKTTAAPNVALSPGISYDQVKLKWTGLASPLLSFDGTKTQFPLTSQDNPIAPITPQHLIVSLYGKVQIPGVDYSVSGTNIVFASAPRARIPSDDVSQTYITFLSGFIENDIVALDNLSNSFGESKKQFTLTRNGVVYDPAAEEYIIAVYDNRLLVPKVDFWTDGKYFIFKDAPLNGRFLSLFAIEAPIPSFGSGAVGYSRISDTGTLTGISTSLNGANYKFEYPPKVSFNSPVGSGAAASALVNGLKSVQLLDGGRGYSSTNPPVVQVQTPTKTGSSAATITATVTDGAVSGLEITNSGSGYTFTPRITFRQPGGAKLGAATITNGQVTGTISVTDGGFGYTTVPEVYVDEPTGSNPVKASLQATVTNGKVTAITILNAGQGYTSIPRIAVIDPVGAQVLQTTVDGDGRVINIELLSGGSGYDDVPSVYVVDKRVDGTGAYAGGSGAIASASIFNGKIIDINISDFGTGYSSSEPPEIVIQAPPAAEASGEIGLNEVTGFTVNQAGSGYNKAKFEGCSRAASGIIEYTEDGNAVFSNDTTASAAIVNTPVKCLDALFVKRLLDKYTEQFLPDVPSLDYSKIDVRTSIKTIKDFYSSKGTSYSIAYLFKLLYGETVSISYPKDQIIKPSDATWAIDTILRATLVSGDPTNIKDALLVQDEDIADANVKSASALVENYISIKTSEVEIFELVLSEETISGTFTVPYKTNLAEPLSTTDSIITVDSTIGWPERNGEFVIGSGTTTEVVQYKEKSLNQFIECTRSVNGTVEDWDSATQIRSNFKVYLNKGTLQEVVMNIVGIVDAQQTTLTDTGSYYLPEDKLTVSKLGGTGEGSELTTWLYNVKKLISVTSITYGGVNDQSATVTCANPHGLLVGDQVTIYGANPIIYNGTFLVTSRDTDVVFQYNLPQPATVIPQGNILVSIDLNKGKSDNSAVFNAIGPYTTNVQNTFFNDSYTYVASTGIPNYKIGPFPGSALLPGNQRKLNRFPKLPTTISTKNSINAGPVGTWVNGVSIWSYKSKTTKTFGAVTAVAIKSAGSGYDAASPPAITISGGGGSGATAAVTVDGAISEITVTDGGSGYTSSPLVSIVGGGGSGGAATAIITKGVVSRILINAGGSGYTSQPQITIVGGGGTGAAGTASVRGPIKSISVSNGGASYTSTPTVSLSSGSGAVAQAIVNNGRIISIAIISAGSGYTTAPTVSIQGVGFGAIARATIDTDGENAGRVTGITIVNKGINYIQGSTIINLTSVGQDATFTPSVFQWTYNLQTQSTFDAAKGAVFEGYNNEYGGEYAHLSNPQRMRYILGDNLFEQTAGNIQEKEDQLVHSPIIGWAFDGNPIYGPYGYNDPTDQTSTITRLNSSYRIKTELIYDATTNPYPVRTAGPLLNEEAAGNFIEDYEYSFGLGELDQYNGRFCKTPQFPDGRYCYFVTIDATSSGNPVFPYVIGPSYNSVVDTWNLSTSAIQQNIPTGVVRYRDPYENVDIDVSRTPNQSTNTLTTEGGEILLFDVEDENRDGVIDADETANPRQLLEESPLQLFDYFPKVKFDSKVDIEVETTTKFEDASVTGFTVENSGKNYQVNDRLTFDNSGTDGTGVSASISRIKGESVASYTFENIAGTNYGVLQTSVPHNLIAGDSVFITYTPIMNNTNKTFVVRQFRGIEEIVIDQSGSGYNEDIPPTITIDGVGTSGDLQAVVSSVGAIETVNILNSGSGYTTNPRVILSHPQVYKKADYYVSKISNNNYVKVNDIFVNTAKEIFTCGKTKDASGNTVAFVAKLSATGVKEWQKTLELTSGGTSAEFERIYVDGNDIWVVGNNRPNSTLLNAYNPDIILCKYTQADNGLSATLNFQKAYAGISGSTRADYVTAITKYSDTRYVIGGYTNTNSANPYDAFIASIDTTGNFSVKRKLASAAGSEKVTDVIVNGTDIYFTMETAATANATAVSVAFGKASLGTNAITIDWVKEISNTLYSFLDTSMCIDEFNEIYLTASCRLKSDNVTRDSFWVGKVDTTGDLIWNYRYVAPGREVQCAPSTAIDIFGDLNVAFTRTDNTTTHKTVDSVKIGYDGKIKNHTTNNFTLKNIEGITVHTLDVDESGDIHLFGQTQWNRNEFIYNFNGGEQTDTTEHYTLTSVGATNAITYADDRAKIFGYNPAGSNATWVNSYLKVTSAQLGTRLGDDWTIEFFIYRSSTDSQTLSQTGQTLVGIGGSKDATGGLWLGYDISSGKLQLAVTNSSTQLGNGTPVESTQTTMFASNSWQAIALTKSGNDFKAYVNGINVISGTVSGTSLGSKDLYIANQVGWGATAADFNQNKQGQFYLDHLRLRNRAVVPTVPSDMVALPPTATFPLAYDWVDDAWFTNALNRYDYIDYDAWGLKVDKNAEASRIGTQALTTNTQIGWTRTAVTPVIGSTLTISNVSYTLGDAGYQSLDFDDSSTSMTQDTETLTYTQDVWSSRTGTVPSPGSQKLKVSAVVRDRYFFKVTDTVKIDNIQELTINQAYNFTVGTKLVLKTDADAFVNSGYIIRTDKENNKIYLAINNNAWSNDLNTGKLSTEQFNEQSAYKIVGPIPNDINEINAYTFPLVNNTTPGTFDIDLDDYNLDGTYNAGGGQNLDSYGYFKPYADIDYSVRIDEVAGGSPYIVGSVINLNSGQITYNASYTTTQITGLTGVLKITLVANLTKRLQVTAVANSDEVYVITATNHYLNAADMIYVDGNPSQTVGSTVYDEYDGAFPVSQVVSPLEFVYKLNQAAVTDPAPSASSVSIFVKSPTLKMYYGHQYLFDLRHSSLVGGNLSFAKDSLYKLEYSFNSIERIGTPGVTGQGVPTPSVKLKVNEDVVTNISYYFDPSRTGASSPVVPGSYLDVVNSPYKGTFQISSTAGETITTGADIFKFPLLNEPEGAADTNQASYSTSSVKAVGSISDIRIINGGGFYTKLPIVTGIVSTRIIERVQINAPGTEYAVGTYTGVPIAGDGEGGLVQITVADGTDDNGVTIPGQIQKVEVTSPGKGYTTATIDVEAVSGILGSGLTGSGAELVVVIPSFGTEASIFTKGDKVGKIKKLKNNNFGYDYPHDYTLRPEITFPINAQLTSTSILSSITVTNPGSGYSTAPAVVITGGGGSGATAEASVKNGRIDNIIVKDPGAGYSSTPLISLRSAFNYVINLDLGLLQFAYPHGITNGAEVTVTVTDTGDGADFPLAAGATGRLNATTTYYAIAGTANSLENDQLKLAITASNAELGDGLTFVNAGTGRQTVLTESFGGAAEANVETSTFLEGELVYQGDTLDVATATGYVSTNSGWQVGPRILKIVDYTGDFAENQRLTGVISKSSGIISDLKLARGVLEIGSITKTTGQFIDDVGKPSEIIQKIQDSYYYQDFSYAVKSAVSISDWKEILVKNVHPASFKVFGELNLNEYGLIPNKETFFELTKSVELAQEAIVPNIQNFALVEPIYSEFNNTEVLFRQKRLTSSENILTSVVQRLDDVSNLFDGERTAFPLTVDNNNVVANANQLMIILNGVVQNPGTSFSIVQDSIVFSEPPQPPASVKYVNITISQINTVDLTFTNQSGIYPNIGNQLAGLTSGAKLTTTNVVGTTITGYVTEGTFVIGEPVSVSATGFSANLATNTAVSNIGLFTFGENVTNLTGDLAKVEQVNLATGQETPIAKLRYGIGASTTSISVVPTTGDPAPVPAGTFVATKNYQFGSEIFTVTNVADALDQTTLTVTRGQVGTNPVGQQENAPIYGTDISVTTALTLSKTAGTYQSTPGLFDIQLNDVIIGAQSGVVASVTATSAYQDPVTNEFIGQVNISEGSSFFGLLFNRITSTSYPNVVLDNISQSQVSIVDYTDNSTAFDGNFPANEQLSNYVIPYDNLVNGPIQENEIVRNYKIDYGNNSGDFTSTEAGRVRKLSFTDKQGNGFFNSGQVIRTQDTKAEVIGYNQARDIVYLGKIGRTLASGKDYFDFSFNGNAQLDTTQKKFGLTSLLLDGTGDYINNVSTSEIAFGSGVYTIEMYIRPITATLTGTKTILDTRTTANEVAARLYIENAQLRYNVNNSDLATAGLTALSADTWYHVAVVRSSTTVKLYLNGVEVGTGTDSSTYVAKPIYIGADYQGSNGFNGHIDEVRLSNTNRYTAAFSPLNGIFQGDANTKLLLHLDGADAQTYTDDWSGVEAFTNGEFFNNDAILASSREIYAHTYNGGTSANAITILAGSVQKDVTDAVYNAGTGDLELTIGSHSYTTSDSLTIGANKLSFTCAKDNNATSHTYPRVTDPAYNTVLGITAVTATTVTVNVGVATPGVTGFTGNSQRYYDAANLIVANKEFIAKESVYLATQKFPSLAVPGGSVNCEDDVKDILDSLVEDLRNGSNNKMWDSSALYVDRTDVNNVSLNHVETEITETVWVYDKVDQILEFIVTNSLWEIQGDHGLLQKTDASITDSTNPAGVHTFVSGSANAITADAGGPFTAASGTTYNGATGELVLEIGSHSLTQSNTIQIANSGIKFTCDADNHATEHDYPRATDPASGATLAIASATATTITVNVGIAGLRKFTPTGATYDAVTGDLTITKASHGLVGPTSLTATGATYNAETGVLQITSNGHNLANGDNVMLEDESITFTCDMDQNRTEHKYPRSSDHASQGWLKVSNSQTNTFEVNVGKSPAVAYNPTVATYDGESGHLVLDVGTNNLRAGTTVKLAKESLSFTCDMDDNYSTKKYPRNTDPVYGDALPILYEGTRHTVTAASYTPTTGKMVLTAGRLFSATNAAYAPTTGLLTLTVPNHGIANNDKIKIADGSITFTCAMDDHGSEHSYPRSTDPQSDKWINVINATTDTFDVNVGQSPTVNFTPTAAAYTPATGVLELTIGTHTLSVGDGVRIAPNSLTFTCNYNSDGNSTQKTYPRSTGENGTAGGAGNNTGTPDPAYNKPVYITNVSSTTITVNVGISSDTSTHNFVTGQSAAVDCIQTGGNYAHIFKYASRNSITYQKHGFTNGDRVRLLDNSLTFTCNKDNSNTEHSYPRPGTDPFAGRLLDISNKTDTTFEVNVGISPDTSTHVFKSAYPGGLIHKDNTITLDVGKSPLQGYDVSNATYDPTNGNMVLTIGTHDLTDGDTVKIQNEAFTFTCDQDSDVSEHSYPRTTIDTHTATTGTAYNPQTGILTIVTSSAHGMQTGDWVKFADNALRFTCDKDGGSTNHDYPRSTDPVSGRWILATVTNSTTFTVDVLQGTTSSNTHVHTFVSGVTNAISQKRDSSYDTAVSITAGTTNKSTTGATYIPSTGILQITSNGHNLTGATSHTVTDAAYTPLTGKLTLTVASHGWNNGDRVRLDANMLKFRCAKDNYATDHTYPRATDPVADKWLTISGVTTNTFDINVSKSQDLSQHVYISSVASGLKKANACVRLVADSLSFTCTFDGNNATKTYPRATDPVSERFIPITNSQTNTFDIFVGKTVFGNNAHTYNGGTSSNNIKVQDGTITIDVGTSSNTTTHAFVRAKSNAIIAGGTYSHTFIPATNLTASTAAYNPTTGVMTITSVGHGMETGDVVKLADNSLVFSCGFGGASGTDAQKSYPRPSDPVSGKWITVTVVDADNFTVQVLANTPSTNTDAHTFVSASTGGITRGVVMTGGSYTHTFRSAVANAIHKEGVAIKLNENALTFTCDMDGDATNHLYPRKTDPAYNSALKVYKYDTNTFTVNVGKSLANLVNTPYTPTEVTYDPSNGNMVLKIPGHELTPADKVTIDDNSLAFTCTMDNNQSTKTYPRPNHDTRASNRVLDITAVTSGQGVADADRTITVNVGAAQANAQFTPSAATYNAVTGDMTLNIGQHGIRVGSNITIANSGLKFNCTMDGGSSNKDYPRASDPYGGLKSIPITDVGYTSHTVEGASYTPGTGVMQFTIDSHGFSNGDYVQVVDGSLTMRCALDGNTTDHAYPRSSDYPSGRWLIVSNVATDTFEVNVGISSDTSAHIFKSAVANGLRKQTGVITVNVGKSPIKGFDVSGSTYDPSSGVLTLTIGNHNLTVGTSIRIANNSLVYQCGAGAGDKTYPRANGQGGATADDPAYNDAVAITAVTGNSITVNVGTSSNTTAHTFQNANNTYTPSSLTYNPTTGIITFTMNGHGFINGEHIQIADESLSFTCGLDNNATTHKYPRATDPVSKKWLAISNVATDTFDVQVLDTIPSTNVFAHSCTQIAANAIKRAVVSSGGDYAHTFVSAVSNCVQYKPQETHTFVSANPGAVKRVLRQHTYVTAATDGVVVLNYQSNEDCTDIQTSCENLINILTDTLTSANLPTPVDHLGTLVRRTPAYAFLGGKVSAYQEVPFPVSYHDAANDIIYTNQIDADTQYRYRDAANLIRQNAGPIVDKASYDMLTRYPDLNTEMPRNVGGSDAGTLQCKTDLSLILEEFCKDLEDGGNFNTTNVAQFYLGTDNVLLHVRLQVFQSIYAHLRLAHYMKQAVTGDLDSTNTDKIIFGDWDITQDGGGCANVKTAIDNLVTGVNSIIVPTDNDYAIGADRLYFNRATVAEEITGLVTANFTITLNAANYTLFSYPSIGGQATGEGTCQRDLKLIMLGIISDLQTGGTFSTIDAIEKYLDANKQITQVENELLATLYAIEQIKTLGKTVLENKLYSNDESVTGDQYQLQHSMRTAYRDTESPTAIASVVKRLEDLVDIALGILSPGTKSARSAAANLFYNKNYYKEEIQTIVNAQFGSGSWTYNTFVDQIILDICHDAMTTDVNNKTTGYEISVNTVVGNFVAGEQVNSSGGGYATVLEFNDETNFFVCGPVTGTAWKGGDDLVGQTSGAIANIDANGIAFGYDWFTAPGNVRTLANARNITSNIMGQVSGANLFTNPENFTPDWTGTESLILDDAFTAPDGTLTAEKLASTAVAGEHIIHRNFNLSAYETFDTDGVKFDSTNETFDTGAISLEDNTQQFTYSTFIKKGEYSYVRFQIGLDLGTAGVQEAFFDLNLNDGTSGSIFNSGNGITTNAFGAIPYGDGWYRVYLTGTFSYGFSELRPQIYVKNATGSLSYTGNGSDGLYVWGAKLTRGTLDPYTSNDGKIFYADNEYNIKIYALDLLQTYITQALNDGLTSPAPNSGFYKYYDSAAAAYYTVKPYTRVVRNCLDIIRKQLALDSYYTNLTVANGISIPSKTYGARTIPAGVGGGLKPADFIYGLQSNEYAELESITVNEGEVVQVYQRFRIDGDITDGPFTMNEAVQKQGDNTKTGVVYGYHFDENYKYLDVKITAGTWAVTDTILGAANSTTAQISAIESRIHIIDLKGTFSDNIPFKGYKSGATATPTGFLKTEASILDNTGGKLTVDTESLLGSFETTSVVYPSASRQYLEVSKYAGLDIGVGDRIASAGYKRFGIVVLSGLNSFTVGNKLYKVTGNINNTNSEDPNTYAIITDVDLDNNYVYCIEYQGTFTQGDLVGDYNLTQYPVGYGQITTIVATAGAAAATVQDIKTVGVNQRLFLSGIAGVFDIKDGIIGPDGYKSAVVSKQVLKARVKRAFKGFDGTTTTFPLTIDNGTQYLPDPDGHLMVFVNGILQPPGGTNAYTAFSNQIQFTEAPDLGASFTGFYVGKMRQLDDISFEFDSLRQSFNLKRNDVFYSLTLTDGVQSSTIRPENNIIVSLNGVIQEPGVGFELVGSRIIFSEVPRVGSTFVGFSYVGSEADVDAAEVVPPVEPGDFIDIQGETSDREVAVIESSNSLITFDYLGSVFGKDAKGQAAITSGFINTVQVTSGGSGYTSRPTVRIDSISGFEGVINALVGVAGVEMSAAGTGYQNPTVDVETSVPDDWTAPDLSLYGEEEVPPN